MTYTADLAALQAYLSTGPNLDGAADSVVFLKKVFDELVGLQASVTSIDNSTTNLDNDKSTANNQTTIINRLTDINNDLDTNIDDSISNLKTSVDNVTTELNSGLLKVAVDNVLTEIADGNIKLNLDSIIGSLGTLVLDVGTQVTAQGDINTKLDTIISSLEGNSSTLVGLDPASGINDTLLLLITDIRNNLAGGTGDGNGQTVVVLADQLLVATPYIRNITLASANTEYSLPLPCGTVRRFSIKSRLDAGDSPGLIRYAYVPGIVANSTIIGDDAFYTVGDFVEDTEDQLNLVEPLTLYFGSDTAGVVVTVKYWEGSPSYSTSPPSMPFVRNVNVVNTDTEYIYEFPSTTKRFSLKVRGNAGDNTGIIRVAYVAGVVATGAPVGNDSYYALQPDGELQENALSFDDTFRVYLASSTANVAVTIEYWT